MSKAKVLRDKLCDILARFACRVKNNVCNLYDTETEILSLLEDRELRAEAYHENQAFDHKFDRLGENKKKAIVMYAITKDGDGYCERVGVFDSMDDITIRVGMFSPDVVLTFGEEAM